MNGQKARKLRRIECAHERFAGMLLALGMPPKHQDLRPPRHTNVSTEYSWYSNDYRERVASFYLTSFSSAPKPNVKTVKKFVRSYMRWLQQQHNQTWKRYHAPEI